MIDTNIVSSPATNIIYNTQPMVGILFLTIVVLLLIIKTAYSEYQHRCLQEKLKTPDFSITNIYSELRKKHNGQQLEFPFVKEIDDSYIAARYNLNVDLE